MKQRRLFNVPTEEPELCDPRVPEHDRSRLSAQCQRILDRLREGPASNAELARIALKYTSRISDLRKQGYDVQLINRHRNGVTYYELR